MSLALSATVLPVSSAVYTQPVALAGKAGIAAPSSTLSNCLNCCFSGWVSPRVTVQPLGSRASTSVVPLSCNARTRKPNCGSSALGFTEYWLGARNAGGFGALAAWSLRRVGILGLIGRGSTPLKMWTAGGPGARGGLHRAESNRSSLSS